MPQPFTVTTRNGKTGETQTVTGAFSDSEWSRLERFLGHLREFDWPSIAHTASDLSLEVSGSGGQVQRVNLPAVGPVEALLETIRPLVMNANDISFVRICNMILLRLRVPAISSYIDSLKRQFSGDCLRARIHDALHPPTTEGALQDWLMTVETAAHTQSPWATVGKVFADAAGKAVFLCSMLERAAAIGLLGRLIDNLTMRDGTELRVA